MFKVNILNDGKPLWIIIIIYLNIDWLLWVSLNIIIIIVCTFLAEKYIYILCFIQHLIKTTCIMCATFYVSKKAILFCSFIFWWLCNYFGPHVVEVNSICACRCTSVNVFVFAFSGGSYIAMLRYLHPENAMLLFYLVLTEHKILIHSLRPTLLTSIAEAITTVNWKIIILNTILLLVRITFCI